MPLSKEEVQDILTLELRRIGKIQIADFTKALAVLQITADAFGGKALTMAMGVKYYAELIQMMEKDKETAFDIDRTCEKIARSILESKE